MTSELIEQVEQNKEEIVKFLAQTRNRSRSKLVRRSANEVLKGVEIPLSFSQESLWFLEQLNPGNAAYNIPLKVRIAASVDDDVLRRSLDEIVRRHEVLRTRFRSVRGAPVQVIGLPSAAPFVVIDLSNEAADVRERKADQWCAIESAKAFRIDQDLLLRAALLRLGPEQHILLLTIHHIAADAYSVDIIVRELLAIYHAFSNGRPSPLSDPAIQYADFALWQRDQVSDEAIERELAYWRSQMASAPPVLEMPVDWPRRAGQSSKGSTTASVFSAALTARLKALGQKEGASLFMVLLTAFQVLLYRCSGQPDVVVGAPISGRKLAELESVVGLFVNTLPLRIDLSGNPSFRSALSRVREAVLAAHENQDIPFETLVKELRPPRAVGRNPLFQTLFTFRSRVGEGALADVNSEIVSNESAKFDLSLAVEEFSDGMKAELEYGAELFRHDRATDFLARLTRLLESIAGAPEMGVDDLPLIDAQDALRALADSNRTNVEFDLSRSVDELIFETAKLHPESEAVRFGRGALTYRQLCERAEDVAAHLRALGVRPDDVVGLCVERSLELVVGLLGILRSGAAFTPLDPHYPRDRLAYMLHDANPAAILTQRRTEEALPPSAAPRICLDDLRRLPRSGDSTRPRRSADLAYVIYTSGSTGAPKGVEVSHRSLMNFLYAMQRQFGVTSKDVVLAVTTISFDIAMLELLLPLLCGGRVVIASREQVGAGAELIRLLRTQKVSLMQATPTTWRLLLTAQWAGSPKLKALCGGEAWTEDLAEALLTRCDSLWNMYGPTETTIWSAVRRINPGDQVLVGGPMANTQFYVLGPNRELEPTDIPGELYIGGAGVARGYRGRPDLTNERFISNPFGPGGQDRLYKTGDRVRRLPNGDIQFLGRLDGQIKIRGFRVELDEIATVLRSHPGVADVVVVVHGGESTEKSLIAYCTGPESDRPDSGDLRAFSKSKLPHYMVPAAFEFLERIPVTPSGKSIAKRSKTGRLRPAQCANPAARRGPTPSG